MEPLINGEAYAWSQIQINIAGINVVGVTAIDYEDTQELKMNYGAGNYPHSRGKGQIKVTASITLAMVEVERLQKKSKTGRLQDLPAFDVHVSYLPEDGTIVKHTIMSCLFEKNSRKVKTGDMDIPVELTLNSPKIKWK